MALKVLRITQAKRRASRIITKRLKAEGNPKKALKLEEDQGYAKGVKSKDGLEREERSY